jgi:hypothetical protein
LCKKCKNYADNYRIIQAIIQESDKLPYEKKDRKEETIEIGLQEFIFGLKLHLDMQVIDAKTQQAVRRTDYLIIVNMPICIASIQKTRICI